LFTIPREFALRIGIRRHQKRAEQLCTLCKLPK
jgi:hypothetical protein